MKKVLLVVTLLFSIQSFSQLKNAKKYAKTITVDDLKEHLYIYASDEFEGRNTGSEGQKKAVEYLRNFYIKNNIEAGDPDKDYFQKMKLNISRGNEGEVESENVIAIIRGTEKPEEYVVLTAHLDHVGYGMSGSRAGRNVNKIHNGADDDGSGTVAVLEIAQAFKKASEKGKGPKRSILKSILLSINPISGVNPLNTKIPPNILFANPLFESATVIPTVPNTIGNINMKITSTPNFI